LNILANQAYKTKNYSNAEQYYKNIIKHDKSNELAYARLGFIELKKNESATQALKSSLSGVPEQAKNNTFEQSINYTEKAINLGLQEPWVYNNLAYAYDNLYVIESRTNPDKADPSKAIEYYNKVLELSPNYTNVYNTLGSIYYQEKQYEKSIQHLKKALENKQGDAQTYSLIGLSYLKLKKYSESVEYLEKAINSNYLDHAFPQFINHSKGFAHMKLGEYSQAILEFTKALSLDPKMAVNYFYRAKSYINRAQPGDNGLAKKDLDFYLSVLPNGFFAEKSKRLIQDYNL
jgi:tetratricopeptide (TPR) repeat protein